MKPTRVRDLLVVFVVVGGLALLLQRKLNDSGHAMPPVPWTAAIGLLLVACLVYSAAIPVRRLTRGTAGARPIDPLRAARIAVLGKATAYAGALLLGWYTAELLLLAPDLDISARRAQALRVAVTTLAALAVGVAGLLAERMCRVPPNDDGTDPNERDRLPGRGEPTGGTDVTGEVRRHE
jgi:hypothetical protein